MKLTYEDKKEIYKLKQEGYTTKELTSKFGVNSSTIRYIFKLANRHGIEILRKDKNNYYPPKLKEEIINKVLLKGNSMFQVSIDYGLPAAGMLHNWTAQYKKNGYTIIENKRGRPSIMKKEVVKPTKKLSESEYLKQLEKENEYLRAENAVLKKLRELRLQEEAKQRKKQK